MRPGNVIGKVMILFTLAGCGSVPVERFYSLEAVAPVSRSGIISGRRLSVGPVSVPDTLDRPQMVWRTGTRQVVIAEQSRWTEPLPTAVSRVVTDNLSREVNHILPVSPHADADIRVELDIRRLDAEPGRQVVLDAVWRIKMATGPKQGHTVKQEQITGPTVEDLVAAHERVLLKLSQDIAAVLR